MHEINENLWKVSATHYALYVSDANTIKNIRRTHIKKGFKEMAVYQDGNKVIARQYLVPIHLLNTAKRFSKLSN